MILDLFAGPGGWDEGLRLVGRRDVLGIDNDAAACDTAIAAGHGRMRADITALAPLDVSDDVEGLIGSPPCPGFSKAGKETGRNDFDLLRHGIDEIATGADPDTVLANVRDRQHDARSALTLEPLRWAWHLDPEWIALEQVPTVLPLWQAYADVLELDGYNVACGYVYAEAYGVPQTRKRAVLVASRNEYVALPTPTHSRYHTRTPSRIDPGTEHWVSMAEALGWGMTQRPYPTIACARTTGGPDKEKVGGSAARRTIYAERDAGRWKPQPAIPGEDADSILWPYTRPSPTIVGSFAPDVVAAPGYRKAGDPPRQKTPGSVRITLQEAAVLQSFPPDYPWQGLKGKQFQQIGNAVPPLLAEAVLAPLAGMSALDLGVTA